MNLPFDAFFCADYIRANSPDIAPAQLRAEQARLKVPCLGALGCRFLSLCAAMKQPKTAIDVGCGIGASTFSMHQGAPAARITAIDGNVERAATCAELMKDIPQITVHNALALPFLQATDERYDFAFVDSVKKMYLPIWQLLRTKLNPGAVVLFDDVLLYGYTAEDEATVPLKYQDGRRELREFIDVLSADDAIVSQIVPLDGGMLLCWLH
ncbi:MAG: class I SAM-dependent methyltransferase [Deferribacteraceae bacterium]|jgi:predicted O-methyltransferase YrrM|nr:class I SAM-dependent methyltransferase [Deferribacteraceae bacterium]